MQQAIRIPRGRFQRVAKRMPKIEQGAIPLLCLIAHHNLRFHLARHPYRLTARRVITSGQSGSVLLQPLEKWLITEQPVFHNLTITGQKIPRGQRV